jgi:tetratricopeptide (TPR) repeat protein
MKKTSSNFVQRKSLVKIVWAAAFLFLLLAGIAVTFVLVVTVRLQRNLLSQAPPYSARQLYDTAVSHVNSGDYGQAEKYLEQALQKQDDSTYRNQLAVVKYRLKKYGESIDQYQKLIDGHTDVAFAENGMGNAYRDWAIVDTGHTRKYQDAAEQAYARSYGADSAYVAAYSNEAQLLSSEGNQGAALKILDQGIGITKNAGLQQLRLNIGLPKQ